LYALLFLILSLRVVWSELPLKQAESTNLSIFLKVPAFWTPVEQPKSLVEKQRIEALVRCECRLLLPDRFVGHVAAETILLHKNREQTGYLVSDYATTDIAEGSTFWTFWPSPAPPCDHFLRLLRW
jgi:hypothetical protein